MQIDGFNIANQVIQEMTEQMNYGVPSFDGIERKSLEMLALILQDEKISSEEKALITQLQNIDPVDDTAVSTRIREKASEVLSIVDQLISGANEDHPYIGFYQFLKGYLQFGIADIYFDAQKTASGEMLQEAIRSLDTAIQLDPTNGESYFVRGIALAVSNPDSEKAMNDIFTAIQLGCQDAQKFINQLIR